MNLIMSYTSEESFASMALKGFESVVCSPGTGEALQKDLAVIGSSTQLQGNSSSELVQE